MAQRAVVLFLVVLTSAWAHAQSQEVTITEPGTYEIGDLFKSADVVALIRIVSGDTENYDCAVYKGKVVQSFKGVQRGTIIYFGPFVGQKLGEEYILFLHDVAQPLSPKTTATTTYGTIHYSKVFNQGFSSMETSYECVFDVEEVLPKCDYAVRVCTDYIKLPKSWSSFTHKDNNPPFGCRWVRKASFLSLLDTLGNPEK